MILSRDEKGKQNVTNIILILFLRWSNAPFTPKLKHV